MTTRCPLLQPYPLRTDRPHRVLAWPRWQDLAELDLLLKTFARALVNRADTTLVLRHDAERDGDTAHNIRVFQERYALVFNAEDELSVLILDEVLLEGDLPRLGLALDAVIALPSSENPERAVFIEDLGCSVLRRVSDLGPLLPGAPTSTPPPRRRKDGGDAAWTAWVQELPAQEPQLSLAVLDAALSLQRRAGLDQGGASLGDRRGAARSLLEARLAPAPLTLLACDPTVAAATGPSDLPRQGMRWVHLHGERTGGALSAALSAADHLCCAQGLAVVEGFFDPLAPQLTWAVIRFLDRNPYAFLPLLLVEHTLLLVRPRSHRPYRDWVRDHLPRALVRRGQPEVSLSRTTFAEELPLLTLCSRGDGPALRGPDWDREQVLW
ncbi:MAG: hypothetical protein JXX28_08910 [Deltaproteobacteria bacterium]|nr:hypothetical protein [Deltaproteobacteria bacterium]